jgi:hypothetical protein
MIMQYKNLTEKIIGCAYRVYNTMGFGFLFGEKKVEVKRKLRELPRITS